MPITPQQGQNLGAGAASASGMLNTNQAQFASRLAADTGLDLYVVAAWVHAEEPASSSQAPNGANNWLNIGATGSGNFGGTNQAWADPISAADATASWLHGNALQGYGAPSSSIQAILSTAGKGAAAQIAAIQHSGWAASGYPSLPSLYSAISGDKSTLAQLADSATAPAVAAGSVVSSTAGAVANVGQAIGQIAALLTSTQFWLRLGEALAGMVLLYLGLHALTGQSSSVGAQAQHVRTRFIPI